MLLRNTRTRRSMRTRRRRIRRVAGEKARALPHPRRAMGAASRRRASTRPRSVALGLADPEQRRSRRAQQQIGRDRLAAIPTELVCGVVVFDAAALINDE